MVKRGKKGKTDIHCVSISGPKPATTAEWHTPENFTSTHSPTCLLSYQTYTESLVPPGTRWTLSAQPFNPDHISSQLKIKLTDTYWIPIMCYNRFSVLTTIRITGEPFKNTHVHAPHKTNWIRILGMLPWHLYFSKAPWCASDIQPELKAHFPSVSKGRKK